MQFSELGLHPTLLANVQRAGYTTPTPIQARSIPSLLAGRDLLGLAQTGTGKTAAFALPVLHRLASTGPSAGPDGDVRRPGGRAAPRRGRKPRALVLAPTRELAGQVQESFGVYGRGTGLTSTVIFGGVGQGGQVAALRAGIDIVVATPGRLLDLMAQGYVKLEEIEALILDEADRMLDMGFIKPIQQIIAKLPARRQNVMFSATMPKPIKTLADDLLRDPLEVSVVPKVTTAPRVDQYVCFVPQTAKPLLLAEVLAAPEAERVIVFTRTKRGADRVAKKLGRDGIEAAVIHGNKSQNARVRALTQFKDGSVRVLVATDVAARGIDVDGVSHVVNYDLPNEPESYVHRIGRTGRAGATGQALSFCDPSERAYLRDIEKVTRKPLAVLDVPADIADATPAPSDEPPLANEATRRRSRRPATSRSSKPPRRRPTAGSARAG